MKQYLIGLDLGQAQDHSALSVVERDLDDKLCTARYFVGHLDRFPLGTPYTSITDFNVEDRLREISIASLKLRLAEEGLNPDFWNHYPPEQRAQRLVVIIDASGARGEAEHLRRKLMDVVYPVLVYITGGNEITSAQGGGYNVPKSYLKGMIQNVLGEGRISAADDLPAGEILRRELSAFRVKVTKAANEVYEANEGEHDDMVIAIGLPLWWGETYGPKVPKGGGPPPIQRGMDPYRAIYYNTPAKPRKPR